jgi:hypothetical protein
MPPIQPTHHPRPSDPHPIATYPHPHSPPIATLTHSDSHPAAPQPTPTLIFTSTLHNPHPAATNSTKPTFPLATILATTAFALTPLPHPSSSFHLLRAVISRRRDVIARRQKGGTRSSSHTKKRQKPTWRYQKHAFPTTHIKFFIPHHQKRDSPAPVSRFAFHVWRFNFPLLNSQTPSEPRKAITERQPTHTCCDCRSECHRNRVRVRRVE